MKRTEYESITHGIQEIHRKNLQEKLKEKDHLGDLSTAYTLKNNSTRIFQYWYCDEHNSQQWSKFPGMWYCGGGSNSSKGSGGHWLSREYSISAM
jgi:hypothetical protein